MAKVKTDTEKKAEDNLKAACARLVVSHGFFAGSVLRKKWICSKSLPMPTIGTDGRDLFYDADYIAGKTVPEVMALLVHEACHDLGLHPFRRGTRHPIGWNYACDQVVNAIVGEVGLTLPPDGLPPIPDTTPEALYEDIMKKAKKLKCNCNLVPPTDEQGNALSGAALAAAEADAKLQAATTAELAKRAGKLPGGLARLVGAALEERVPWVAIVQRFVAQSSKLDSSWRKPNRRYLSRGIVLPSLWSPDVPDFVLACDTSGSIDEKTLRTVCGEVLHALATCEKRGAIRLQIVWCDTEVSAQTVEAASELEPRGGGGTMYSPVFAWVNENNAQTKGVVYVTDGYCSDFGEEPSYPCLWILTAPNDSFHPPWGEIAYIM